MARPTAVRNEGDTYEDIEGLFGSMHDDSLAGDVGHQSINGFHGNDVLDGREGDDRFSGGEGDDTFVFAPGNGNDHISDFGMTGLLRAVMIILTLRPSRILSQSRTWPSSSKATMLSLTSPGMAVETSDWKTLTKQISWTPTSSSESASPLQ